MNSVASNGIFTLYAGDSFAAPIFLSIDRKGFAPVIYDLKEGDKLYVGIMEPQQHFSHALIRKVLTKDDTDKNGVPIFRLTPEDTEHIMPGLYYYEIKLAIKEKDDTETVITVVPKTKLYVLE